MHKICFFLLFASALFAEKTEDVLVQRVYDHLYLKDTHAALKEAEKALELNQGSKSLTMALISALSSRGEEIEALSRWTDLTQRFEEEKKNPFLLESLAWGVLNKAESSPQLTIRLNALLGVSFTRSAKAVPIILGALRDTNSYLRSVAVQIATMYGDLPLQEELIRMLKEEKIWYVRQEVIKAIGKLRIHEFTYALKEMIGSKKTMAEEKVAAIIALVGMMDKVDRQELLSLAKSPRSGLRHLACQIVTHLELKEDLHTIIPLIKDSSYDVQVAALNAIGLLRPELSAEATKQIKLLTDKSHPVVAITAGWVLMLYRDPLGEQTLLSYIGHEEGRFRRLASAALCLTGKTGIPQMKKLIREIDDPYIQVNCALALLGQRVDVQPSCAVIDRVLTEKQEELWMWDESENPLFRTLAPSRVTHVEQMPNYPAVVDQMTRIDLLKVLGLMQYPGVNQAVKQFLTSTHFGVCGAAAAHLLTEGDEDALEIVRGLLDDPEEMIRIQAALILALVGSDRSVGPILQEAYPKADREMKIQIVQALSHIGDPETIPFLVQILKEPFQILRVVAASALIQCLNN